MELGDESEKSFVLDVTVFGDSVGEIEFLNDVQPQRDEVLNLVLQTLELCLDGHVIVPKRGEIGADLFLDRDDPVLS